MRQRFFKAILSVALMISVFFSFSSISLAEETDDVPVDVVVSEKVAVTYTAISQQFFDESNNMQIMYASGYVDVPMTIWSTVNKAGVLNGWFSLDTDIVMEFYIQDYSETYKSWVYVTYGVPSISFQGTNLEPFNAYVTSSYPMYEDVVESPESGSIRYTQTQNFGMSVGVTDAFVTDRLMVMLTARIPFNLEIHSTPTGADLPLYVSVYSNVDGNFVTRTGDTNPANSNLNNIINAIGSSSQQEMQQSAQQHEDLKNGFQDDTYNNNVSNAGSQVDSYIDLEHNLLEQQNQQMSEYADSAFNLNTISPYINAIAMTSTFFTWIWNGYGELNVVFVIVLAIGVACLILGIRRRG